MEEVTTVTSENLDLQGIAYVSTENERQQFIEFPYKHYAGDPVWVPPLKIQQKELIDTRKNPFYKNADVAFFLAYHNGSVAGRIAAIHNHAFNRSNNDTAGFFGFFECIENEFVANLLFRVVGDWLRKRGCTRLLGPMNPGLLDEIGIQVEGFEHRPAIMMPHSKPWYDRIIRSAGLEKAVDLYSCKVTRKTIAFDRLDRALDIVKKRTPGITVRSVNLRDFEGEVNIIHRIFNKAWAKNWGFYEVDLEVLSHLAKDLKRIVDPDFAHIAEINGEPVAFSIALPDYNQVFQKMDGTLFPTGFLKLLWHRRKIDALRTALMGVLPEYQGRGIDALLAREAMMNGFKREFQTAEVGWLLETNTDILRVVERAGAKREKVYRLYSQEII